MADLRNWRPASDPPPEGVPVLGILADGTGGWYERARDDEGYVVWAESERIFWDRRDKAWSSDAAYYDDDYRVRYWHPLPAVPTLAELDGASRDLSADRVPLDCGDSSCRSPERGRGGMRTNGGCRCDPEMVAQAHERIAAMIRRLPSYAGAADYVRPAAEAASGGGEG